MSAAHGGIGRLGRRWLFGIGVLLVVAGVGLHLPMFLAARPMDYRLVGMPVGPAMWVGMALLVLGTAAAFLGLLHRDRGPAVESVEPAELESAGRLTGANCRLIAVLVFAIAVDAQKPFSFTFILPGVAAEYGLSTPDHHVAGALPVGLLPFAGILGTTVGSLLWGQLGDRWGRRSALLFAAVVFAGTSVCGAMPTFLANVVMCLLMGLGVGGLLPVAYTLLAETVPARRRGFVLVLVGGLGSALGFLLASWVATLLMPTFGWRITWFAGLPTGLLLLLANRWIPESPRFLSLRRAAVAVSSGSVFRRGLGAVAGGLLVCGLAWGAVNYGFLVWLPTRIGGLGIGVGRINGVLAEAALLAVPGVLLVAWLYSWWSTRRTVVATAALTGVTLLLFVFGDAVVRSGGLLLALVVVLLLGSWAVNAVLGPYTAEICPTGARARGSALVAGAAKLGGVAALAMTVLGVAPPGLTAAAALAAVPMLVAAAWLGAVAVETRAARLEEIGVEPA